MVGRWGPPAPTVTHQTQMGYSEQVRDQARATAAYLREVGWQQRRDGGNGGPCCAYKAMEYAIVDCHHSELRKVILKETGCEAVMLWNDRPDQTAESILAFFDRIANG